MYVLYNFDIMLIIKKIKTVDDVLLGCYTDSDNFIVC